MKRSDAIRALEGYGAADDRAGWTRIYAENRISFAVAQEAWRKGANLRRFVEARDAAPPFVDTSVETVAGTDPIRLSFQIRVF